PKATGQPHPLRAPRKAATRAPRKPGLTAVHGSRAQLQLHGSLGRRGRCQGQHHGSLRPYGSRRLSLLRGNLRLSRLRGSRRPSLHRLSRLHERRRQFLRPHGSRRVEQKLRPGSRSSRAGQQQQQAKTVSWDASFERQPSLRILSRADIERDMNGSSSIKDCPAVKPPGTAKLAVTLSLVWLAWII